MTREDLPAAARSRSSVSEKISAVFAAGMDDRWFDSYDDELLFRHLECASSLNADSPFALFFTDGPEPTLSVVTWDAKGLFSLISGVLAASGFSILGGDAFTVRLPADGDAAGGGKRRRQGRAAPKKRKRIVVDVFRGRLEQPECIERWFRDVKAMFGEIGPMLASGEGAGRREARSKVQRWVAEAIGKNTAVRPATCSPWNSLWTTVPPT